MVLGGSGEGKSVLLRHINGLERPDAGEVFADGKRLNTLSEDELFPIRRDIAMVFQLGALFDSLSVFGNVAIRFASTASAMRREFANASTKSSRWWS